MDDVISVLKQRARRLQRLCASGNPKALARLAAMPSVVDCECLRHMAEIVTQLAGFERYSQECTSAGPDDAALHRQLAQTAGAARTLFETALARVVR